MSTTHLWPLGQMKQGRLVEVIQRDEGVFQGQIGLRPGQSFHLRVHARIILPQNW